ncbi:MAG: adenylate kinase [Candidatus Muirbacterium halophilum]|nr:adenylate kinase [Candidatus Muirbacterium halophilum]MCK9475236.1 adenylate kinase [Candidatus Muirbacterium halophilum]
MIILLIGSPGAGKGTQAKLLEERFNLEHLAPGDILRDEIQKNTPLGIKAKVSMDKGHLVPDNMIVDIMLNYIKNKTNVILDGFPRNICQAKSLDEFLAKQGRSLDHVFRITVSEDETIRRLSGRRVCPKCGSSYNLEFNPPVIEGICDKDGEKLVQREDDHEFTIRNRFEVFNEQTKPLIKYYSDHGKFITIDGERDHMVIFEELSNIVNGKK